MNEQEEFDIRQYVSILKKRKKIVISAFLLCILAASFVSFTQPKVYQATSQVILSPQQDVTVAGATLSDPNQFRNYVGTQARLVESPAVQTKVDQVLAERSSEVIDVSAAGVTNTRLLSITVKSESPEVAQMAANTYANEYIKNRQNAAIDGIFSVGEQVNEKQKDIESRVATLDARISSLAANSTERSELEKQKESLNTQLSELQARYDKAQAEAFVRDAGAEKFADADLPADPVSPQPLRNITLAVVLGLLLGVGVALVIERTDDRVDGIEKLSRWLPEIVHLGSVPSVSNWENNNKVRTSTVLQVQPTAAEAYRGLRTSLQFLALDSKLQVIQLTSSIAEEGKSTTAANLATVLAWLGGKVIIIDADLRRPRLHEFYGMNNEKGFTSLMISGARYGEVIQRIDTDKGELSLLSAGPVPPNPAELLASSKVGQLIEELRSEYDYIVIDSPPLLPVADPLVISAHADGVLMVSRVNKVRKKQLERSAKLLKQARARVVGVVLNGVKTDLAYNKNDPYYKDAAKPSMS